MKKNDNEDKIFTIPNIITMGRIAASAAIFTFILASGTTLSIPLAALTAAVGSTDFLDGYIARSRNMSSKLGKLLDPIADKFYNWGLGFTLMATGAMPLWPLLIAGRDLSVASFYYYQKEKNGRDDLGPTLPAKVKMLLQSVGTVSTLAFGFGTQGLSLIAPVSMGAAIACTIPEVAAIKKKYFSKKKEVNENKYTFVPSIDEDKDTLSKNKEQINKNNLENSKIKNKVLSKKKTRGK